MSEDRDYADWGVGLREGAEIDKLKAQLAAVTKVAAEAINVLEAQGTQRREYISSLRAALTKASSSKEAPLP